MYGSECWRITKGDMRIETLMSFITAAFVRSVISIGPIRFIMCKCIRRQTYEYVPRDHKIADSVDLRWLSHVFRMPENRIPKVAMRWTPSRRRKRSRPKTSWRRTVMKELEEIFTVWLLETWL